VWAVGFVAALLAGTIVQSVVQRRVLVVPLLILATAIVYGGWRMSSASASEGPTVALMPGQTLDVPAAEFALWSEAALEDCTPLPTSAALVQGFIREESGRLFNSLALLKDGQLLLLRQVQPRTLGGILTVERNRVASDSRRNATCVRVRSKSIWRGNML
jgi:hypothetical protein